MKTRTVMCYGDSNTHGTMPMASLQDMGRFGPETRWPGVLAAALGDRWRVVEEGLPGRTTVFPDPIGGAHRDGLAVLPALLESHRPLDLVAIMLGTNDMKQRFQMPVVEAADAVLALVAAVRTSTAGVDGGAPAVLLIAPPPVLEAGCLGEIFTGGAEKSKRLGAIYAEAAKRAGVAFLDAGEVIGSSPVDGVHFDAEAHARLGQAVAEAIAGLAD
ncbi:SGNH/GDSL hydrolase family protein [Amaricoccus solimangrovi]|uniref:Hydrolase n=1 Tax=Amaricoccus solimangrovi TaxID=2589815 RepID=A0A501WUM7_9RHOB|nr:SGNH/GDSL hydrolase family protein [Amaricoccus solimangrovi]TPE52025.1 hydrolase [Amaricoccus solimangrovi]